MIIRVCLPSGAMERVTLTDSETLNDLGTKIEKLDKMDGEFKLFSDRRFTQPFVFESVRHGDVIYIQGTMKPQASSASTKPPQPTTTTATTTAATTKSSSEPNAVDPSSSSTANGSGDGAKDSTSNDKGPMSAKCRLHGPRGMCEKCMPKEDKRARAEAELKKHANRGSSIAVLEALEALKFKISAQDEAYAKAAAINSEAANAFQAYLAETAFSQQRVGYCFGELDEEEKVTNVHTIYEPPQAGTVDGYKLANPSDAGDMTERAHGLAGMIGMEHVGIVLSARPRKCILSAMDVVFAAEMLSKLPERLRKAFIIFVVTTAETGQTLFEAYQISDLAVELYKEGVFEDIKKQKANGGRVLCKEDVLVQGKDTKKVPTEFFILNIPIKSCESWLRTSFTIENRDITPQNPGAMARIVRDDSLSYAKRLADFHLLLFLSNVFDMKTDMPGLSASVKGGDEVDEGYRLMIENMASQ